MTTHLRSRDPGPELPGLARTLDLAAGHEFDLGAVRTGIDGLVVRRRRRRRQLASGLASAAAVVVVAGSTWLLAPGRDLGDVATPVPPATAAPSEPPAVLENTTAAPPALPYEVVPDDVVPTDGEIGEGVLRLQQDEQYADVPVVMGQGCNQGREGAVPVGARSLAWFDPALQQGGSVNVTVTVWAEGVGGTAFADVVADTGRCRWVDDAPVVDDGPWEGEDRFLVRGEDVFGAAVYRAVARVGDVLVGVEVNDPRGAGQAQSDAERLADLVAQRVLDSGMPAAR